MCAIFGLVNYKHLISKKRMRILLNRLAVASEVRGTDASGIAYVKKGKMVIYKRPVPARKMHFSVPSDTMIVTGHTRFTTQGSAELNFNNHPFIGRTEEGRFALCHNGVLCNDDELSKTENLPETPIQTDSYVAVQLIEKQGVLDFESIAQMSEKVMGSFVFTILRDDNTLYISKGDNPICLLHFKDLGLYIYSSTPDIMEEALKGDPLAAYDFEEIRIYEGEIIRIDKYGQLSRSRFTLRIDYGFSYNRYWQRLDSLYDDDKEPDIPPDDLDLLYEMGYLDEDIEILTNDRELLRYCIEEARMLLYGYA